VLNAGTKVAMLVGRAPAAPHPRSARVADVLGAGVAKALLGKDVLSDELPWGHRGHRDCRQPGRPLRA